VESGESRTRYQGSGFGPKNRRADANPRNRAGHLSVIEPSFGPDDEESMGVTERGSFGVGKCGARTRTDVVERETEMNRGKKHTSALHARLANDALGTVNQTITGTRDRPPGGSYDDDFVDANLDQLTNCRFGFLGLHGHECDTESR